MDEIRNNNLPVEETVLTEEERNEIRKGRLEKLRALQEKGENPFILDSKAPTGSYIDFIKGEVRYSSLELAFPERAKELFAKAEQEAIAYREQLEKMADPHNK